MIRSIYFLRMYAMWKPQNIPNIKDRIQYADSDRPEYECSLFQDKKQGGVTTLGEGDILT